MNEIEVGSFEEFHCLVQCYKKKKDIYRGLSDDKYQLVPKIGWVPLHKRKSRERAEEIMFNRFKERALPYLESIARWYSDWDWLAIAQNYGLPTRLLDWTRNPLVALYFAVEREKDCNSAVYVLKGHDVLRRKDYPNPFKYPGVGKFVPDWINARISAQLGVFTIHHEPEKPFSSDSIDKLIIPKRIRGKLKKIVDTYGINRATLFPDLDGLAHHIKWQTTSLY
jgi:hypothetical protein